MSLHTRRRLLASLGAAAVTSTAGCAGALGGARFDWPSTADEPTEPLPGEAAGWSQFGRDPGHAGVAPDVRVDDPGVDWTVAFPNGLASPAVVGDRVFVHADVDPTPDDDFDGSAVLALDAGDGQRQWRRELPVFEAFSGCPPVVYRGSVYVGHASESGLYAVDARDGTARWARETRNSVNEPALGADGRVVASDGDDLLATDERGRELWTYRTGDDRSSHAPPAWGGGHVVYTTSIIGSVVGIDREFGGSISEWRYVADSGFGTPTVADETVYVPGSDRLHAIDVTTGDGRWTAAAEASRGVATDGDRLYVPTEDGALLALATADGSEQWRATLATDADVYLRTRPCVTARSVVVTTEKPQLDERVVTYGLDRTTGEERWRVEQPGNLGYDAVAAGDRVYVPVGWSTREADSTLVALSG